MVDAQMCHGHQMCAIAAPENFGSDDLGYAVVLINKFIYKGTSDAAGQYAQ